MKKILSIIFAWILICLGSALEVKYYIDRFLGDGINIWWAAIIGSALTIALALAVFRKNKKLMKPLIVGLIVYSILATSAGQNFSFNEVKNKDITNEVQSLYSVDRVESLKKQISKIDQELERIDNYINSSVESLKDRWNYRTPLIDAENQKKELKKERESKEQELNNITSKMSTHGEKTISSGNIYMYYNGLVLNSIPENILQFIFQTFLSFLIAIMAPLGIEVLNNPEAGERQQVTRKEKIKLDDDIIRKWIHFNWIGMRQNKTTKMLSRKIFEKFMQDKQDPFDPNVYDQIYKLAIKSNIIDKEGTIKEKDVEKCLFLIKSVDKL